MLLQGFPVAGKVPSDSFHVFLVALLAQVIDERRVFLDGRRQTGGVHQCREVMFQHAAFAGLRQTLFHALAGFFVLDRRDQFFHIDARIPHVQDPHLAVFRHVFAIGPHATQHGIAGDVFAEAVVAAGQDETGGQAFHIPLPGRGQGLVEVVDVEDHAPFRGRERAKIQQMTVAASLHAEPRGGRAGQVRGHVERRPAKEGERGLQHASVANRDELGDASLVRFLQQGHRIRPIVRRLPDCVLMAGALFPQALAHLAEFRDGRMQPESWAGRKGGRLRVWF